MIENDEKMREKLMFFSVEHWTSDNSSTKKDKFLSHFSLFLTVYLNTMEKKWEGNLSFFRLSTEQMTTAQPKQKEDKFLSHFSLFLTIYLLFKCHFVAWQRGFPWKCAYCVSMS